MTNSKNIFKENSKTNFDKQAEHYDEGFDGKFVKVMYDEIIRRVNDINPKSLLDVGCGTGNILLKLCGNKNIKLYGLDLSEKMIETAENKLNGRAELKVGDAEFMPWQENSFEVIICNASFHHYPNPEKVLLEMKRLLKENGKVVIGDPTAPLILRQAMNLFCKISNNGDYKIYSKKEIKELLIKCGFKPFDFKRINYRSFAINAYVEK
ncbi:class I SAM-dependent methyltransferase [Clostridium vincentii]|uniref:Demethylrebeccamycin-D-glucose O-methyltransferase n=1 Tax=Clostridium vincentii TaxID=52704 RepID=A0A2T0BAV9_9CLOT|nr:class I SAM-dependent methyltransferase [Clostridium vincentii]PRR80947.1 Demethylrebeccamycin-D-glucose O-methyltransferase [Clostridium vincentii]